MPACAGANSSGPGEACAGTGEACAAWACGIIIPVGLARFFDDANVRAENVPTSVGNADVPIMYHTDLCR